MEENNHLKKPPFPNENIPPVQKAKKNYGLQVAKAIYYYRGWGDPRYIKGSERNDQNRRYYYGEQDVKDMSNVVGVENSDATELGDVWLPYFRYAIKNYVYKLVNAVVTEITRDHDPVVSAVDPLAVSNKKDMRYRAMLRMLFNEQFERMKLQTGTEVDPDAQTMPLEANSMEELELLLSIDSKEASSLELELGIIHELDNNRYQELKRMRNTDVVLYGEGIHWVGVGPDLKVEIKRIDPDSAIFPPLEVPSGEKIKWAGYIEQWDVAKLKRYAGSEITDEQIDDIMARYSKHSGRAINNDYLRDEFRDERDVEKINVMYFEYYSVDTDIYKMRKDRFGNNRTLMADNLSEQKKLMNPEKRREHEEKKGEKVVPDVYETQYSGWWVVDTDFIFKWGRKNHVEYRYGNLNQTIPGFKIYRPGMYNGKVVSLMDIMRPILDELYETNLKIRQMLYAAVPKGVVIDVPALISASFSLGPNEENLTPRQLLEMFFQRGIMFANSGDRVLPGTSYKPIEEIENGLPKDFMVLTNRVRELIAELEDNTGLNKSFLASNQSSEKGKAVTEYEIAGTQKVLEYLIHADYYLDKEVFSSVGELHLQTRRYTKNQDYFLDIFGVSHLLLINDLKEMGSLDRWYSFDIEPRPTQNEWASLYREASESKMGGQITMDDFIMLKRFKSYRQAENYLRMKIRKNRADAMRAQQMAVQQNAQVQAMSNQQAAQANLQLEEAKLKRELILKEKEMEIERMKAEYRLAEKAMVNAGADQLQTKRLASEADTQIKKAVFDANSKLVNAAMQQEADHEIEEMRQKNKKETDTED